MTAHEIAIGAANGSFMGYLALPGSGSGPGVVIIQEIFGINPWIREVADWYASQGYVALAPDLFWRMKPGIQLDPTREADFAEGLGYYQKFDVDMGIEDIQATIDTLRRMPACSGKVGNLGFCLGGLLSYLAAARTDTEASASYYGGGVHTRLAEIENIKAPAILHLAGNDAYVPPDANNAISAAAKRNSRVQVHVYPDMPHAFCRTHDPRHFNAQACALAHQRTLDLFKHALR